MPVSVVVGAQYGSEGKGKVAHEIARQRSAVAAVRVGGSNSGHTAMHGDAAIPLRQLPTSALLDGVVCVIPPGAYIDVPVLEREIRMLSIDQARIAIDPRATVVTDIDRNNERGLRQRIGSTETGVGAAVARRVRRLGDTLLAGECPALQPYLEDTSRLLRTILDRDETVVVEGTQGYGLSVLHGAHYPMATSRDTTAAAALSEAGLSPLDVDDVILVARAFPIRVAGNSGPLPHEIDWDTVRAEGDLESSPIEYATVTGRERRVARFDSDVVRRAIACNRPTTFVLNHVDLLMGTVQREGADRARRFVASVEAKVARRVDLIGLGPSTLVERAAFEACPYDPTPSPRPAPATHATQQARLLSTVQ